MNYFILLGYNLGAGLNVLHEVTTYDFVFPIFHVFRVCVQILWQPKLATSWAQNETVIFFFLSSKCRVRDIRVKKPNSNSFTSLNVSWRGMFGALCVFRLK